MARVQVQFPSSYPPASELTPIYSPPIASYYPDPEVPTPGPDVVPTSPPSTSMPNPVVLAPSSYPPTESAPISGPPLPAYNPYYPEPSPGPTATPPFPSSPMPDPVVPAPSSYPLEPVPISLPLVPPSPEVPVLNSYPPTEPVPISSPPAPAYYPYPEVPNPSPDGFPPTLPIPNPVAPGPSSYPPTYVPAPTPEPVPHPGGIKATYWPSFDEVPASSIDTSSFTHIYHAFLFVDPISFKLNVTSFDQTKIPVFMGSLYGQNPPVRTLLSIGGGGANQIVFSQMAMTSKTRLISINSTIEVARSYEFDGVDLDWESFKSWSWSYYSEAPGSECNRNRGAGDGPGLGGELGIPPYDDIVDFSREN
ncbi:hypothetical protein SLA2020_478030 [Shorea laevis]